jgi:hypothetical protein
MRVNRLGLGLGRVLVFSGEQFGAVRKWFAEARTYALNNDEFKFKELWNECSLKQ